MAILDHRLAVARTGAVNTAASEQRKNNANDDAAEADIIFVYKGGRAPEHVTHVRIDKSSDAIDDEAFEYCISLDSIETHDGLRRIGKYSFHRCHSLKGIKMPGVKEIDEGAFWGCSRLSEVEFGAHLQRIGEGAFSHCTLKRLTIPSRVSIEKCAFIDCVGLTDVELSGGFDKIEKGAFHGCRHLRLKISGVTVIGEEFIGSRGISDLEFSNELELVRANAFARCGSLKGVTMPSVRAIEKYAFSDCVSLKSLKMPSVLSIGQWAFNNCEELSDMELSVACGLVEKYAFNGCRSLRRIAIPLKDGVISDKVFNDCDDLAKVDLVGDVHKVVSMFGLESRRSEMKEEINRINQDLLQLKRQGVIRIGNKDVVDATDLIQRWIRSVLEKYTKVGGEHSKLLKEAAKGAQKQWSSLFSGLTTIDHEEFVRVKERVMLQIRETRVSTPADSPHVPSKKEVRKKEEKARKAAQAKREEGGFLSRLAAGVPSLEKKDLR
jgi:hypothetical protein